MSSATPKNYVVCVHGVCRHYKGYQECWGSAISRHLRDPSNFNFVGVRWNRKDDQAPVADCRAEFPSAWIQVETDRGTEDSCEYVWRRRRSNPFREEAITRCQDFLTTLRSQDPDGVLHVIGHSLGSVVAYQALHRLAGSVAVRTLITVGSVLGFDFGIVPLLEAAGLGAGEKLKRPPVERWYNLMDERDFVYQLGQESVFDEVESGPNDVDRTGDLFESEPDCPGLPPIRSRPILKIDHDSVCAHLYYFAEQCNAAKMLANILEGRPID
jgi:hypothetical protein